MNQGYGYAIVIWYIVLMFAFAVYTEVLMIKYFETSDRPLSKDQRNPLKLVIYLVCEESDFQLRTFIEIFPYKFLLIWFFLMLGIGPLFIVGVLLICIIDLFNKSYNWIEDLIYLIGLHYRLCKRKRKKLKK